MLRHLSLNKLGVFSLLVYMLILLWGCALPQPAHACEIMIEKLSHTALKMPQGWKPLPLKKGFKVQAHPNASPSLKSSVVTSGSRRSPQRTR